MTLDPVPLCTVSEMGIHLRRTILDCDSALKDQLKELDLLVGVEAQENQ